MQRAIRAIDLSSIQASYLDTIGRLRRAGIAVSDRRAVKLQRVIAASAVLAGRTAANRTDLWVLRYIWDTEEQQEIIAAIVDSVLSQASSEEQASAHPRAQSSQEPNSEELSREIEQLGDRWKSAADDAARAALRDQLTLLTSRIAWVAQPAAREHLNSQTQSLWKAINQTNP
jgi:MoxR-like ATPase